MNALPDGISRRTLLRGTALVGAGALASSALAGCSSGGNSGGHKPSTGKSVLAGGTPKPGGRLRVAVVGGGDRDSLSASQQRSVADAARQSQLYDQLVVTDPSGGAKLQLAEEITSNAAGDVWTIRVREGIEFHHGKTLGADDVIYSFERILDPNYPNTAAAALTLDARGMRKIDERTVRFTLKSPDAFFQDRLKIYPHLGIVPADYDEGNPVGTGPFRTKSFTPGRQSVFVKNPNYWQNGQPYLDEVVIINIDDPAARVNALLSGQVDAAAGLLASQYSQVEGSGRASLLVGPGSGMRFFTMRADQAPFNDVRARQAMRLLVDREQMLSNALSGSGALGNDLFSPTDPNYNTSIPQREVDVDQARSLLKSAGLEGMQVELTTADIQSGLLEASQLLVSQAKAAGVDVKLRKLDTNAFFTNYGQHAFAPDYSKPHPLPVMWGFTSIESSPYNVTKYVDKDFSDVYAAASRTMDETKRRELMFEAQELQWDHGANLVFAIADTVDGVSNNLRGFTEVSGGESLSNFGLSGVWFES